MSAREQRWALHETPHRHYKYLGDDGKWRWQIGKQRIAGVTSILDAEADALLSWHGGQVATAYTAAAETWLGAGPVLAESVLSLGELAALTGHMPNDVRDAKAAIGTRMHEYLADRLAGVSGPGRSVYEDLPYGLCVAVYDFIRDHGACPVFDHLGSRVERAVGSVKRAVGGTYDAQVWMETGKHGCVRMRHRIDLKSSNTVQPKHFAQVAEYERCAVECGESPSDYLTIVHIQPSGHYDLYSIAVASPEHELALAVFDAHLLNHRGLPALGKLLKGHLLEEM